MNNSSIDSGDSLPTVGNLNSVFKSSKNILIKDLKKKPRNPPTKRIKLVTSVKLLKNRSLTFILKNKAKPKVITLYTLKCFLITSRYVNGTL